jgi:PBSX family phage terminase large subunit
MTTQEITITYNPRGAAANVFRLRDPEVIVSGPAGTGRSRAILERLHLVGLRYPDARMLMLRKTRRSLSESGMVTYWQKIRPDLDRVQWKPSQQQYQYPNGSIIAVGGLDKPSKIMSSEWDIIYCQEATELTEIDWESCTIRLRNGKLPYQQLIGDCNPDAPTHWLRQRATTGKTLLVESRHEDNPVLFDDHGIVTTEGERYLSTLDALTGVRYARYRLGQWAAAEGTVYEQSWDRARNVIDRFPIPLEWPRFLAIDFGFVHPFVCLWAARDDDGRLYIYRQICKTQTLVEDHAKVIRNASRWGQDNGDPLPRLIICDHDAEDRATLERHLNLRTVPANKTVSPGIQATSSRFKDAGDGKPRVMIFRDCLIERDRDLMDKKLPTWIADEPDGYVWDTRQGLKHGEAPLKECDDNLDALRYLIAQFDLKPSSIAYSQRVY